MRHNLTTHHFACQKFDLCIAAQSVLRLINEYRYKRGRNAVLKFSHLQAWLYRLGDVIMDDPLKRLLRS